MPINETFCGFIETTTDALLLFEACRRGILPKISRRLQERERTIIRSGSVFIFDEKESGIKRWTDGRAWSPSRILGNFLIYRELDSRESLSQKQQFENKYYQPYYSNPYEGQELYQEHKREPEEITDEERQRDRNLIGSLTDTYKFLRNGLVKKTISIHIDGRSQHLVSYYSKLDVIGSKLATPSSTAELSSLQISSELLLRQSFRVPPSIEFAEMMLKGPSLSPPSSTSSSSNSSRRISDTTLLEQSPHYPNHDYQYYKDYNNFQNSYSNSSRRLSAELCSNSRKYVRTTNESYAGEDLNRIRKDAESDNFNMPPLSIVTENIPVYNQGKYNKDRMPVYQSYYKHELSNSESQDFTTHSFNSNIQPNATTQSNHGFYERGYESRHSTNSNTMIYKTHQDPEPTPYPHLPDTKVHRNFPQKPEMTPFSSLENESSQRYTLSLPSPASMIWSKTPSHHHQISPQILSPMENNTSPVSFKPYPDKEMQQRFSSHLHFPQSKPLFLNQDQEPFSASNSLSNTGNSQNIYT